MNQASRSLREEAPSLRQATRSRQPLWLMVLLACCTAGCMRKSKPEIREPSEREVQQLRYQLAEELVARRDYQSAAPFLRDLVDRYPRNARLHLLLGKVLREKGVYKAAKSELERAIALAPKSPDGHVALAVLLAKQQRLDSAEEHHRKAVDLAPGVARYHNDLAVCLMAQRRYDDAQRELEEALRLDPTMRRAFNNLGFVLGLLGKREAAFKAFSQGGSRAAALTNMGYVEELRGQPMQARRYYERALDERRRYGPAAHNLGVVDPTRVQNPLAGESSPPQPPSRAPSKAAPAVDEGGKR